MTIAVVGKYTGLLDAYKSLAEALTHGGIANNVRVERANGSTPSDLRERRHAGRRWRTCTASWCRAASASAAREGKIEAARFARERGVPYFGICFGMQMAVVEAARNLAGIPGAGSTEFGPCAAPVVGLMTEWMRGNRIEQRAGRRRPRRHHATRRLRVRPQAGQPSARAIFDADRISERHRHRYEVNNNYIGTLERRGLLFSGMSPDGLLPEIIEIPDHPWFIGVQFHPELRSRPFAPHPLFASFIRAAVEQSRLV